MVSPLPAALVAYDRALSQWDEQVTAQTATLDHALEILHQRDALQVLLNDSLTPSDLTLQRLYQLDHHLRQEVAPHLASLDLAAHCQRLTPPPTHWWWYLGQGSVPNGSPDRFNSLWRGGNLLLWTISLGLLGDMSRRIFLGGPGLLGFATITFSGLLTLLSARSELWSEGDQGVEELLDHWQVPKAWREVVKLAMTGTLALGLAILWSSLPLASRYYNERGIRDLDAGRIGSAQANLERAIALDHDNADAHYNLGDLYESIRQFDQARNAYHHALRQDVPQAYNNLARLYLLPHQSDPAAAVVLTTQGLTLLEEQATTLQGANEYWALRHSLFKNRGWARLQQGRFEEAAADLQAAIALHRDPRAQAEIVYPAAAHCLLAQVQDGQGNSTAALESWQLCDQLGNPTSSDEDTWKFEACQRLREEDRSCSQ